MPLPWCPTVLVAAMFLQAGAVTAPADETVARQAEALLAQVTRSDGPGAAVLIARGDRVIVRAARGRASMELGVALSPEHVFRIASVTKIFIAASVLKLAEAGTLSLDDALAAHLPDLPGAGSMTIRQLLNHTAGVSDTSTNPHPGFVPRNPTIASRLADIGRRPHTFAPGSSWRYSNAGYIVLGAVIEKVSGQPWPVTLERQFFAPLGMMRTAHGGNAALIAGRAAGYTTQDGVVTNAPFVDMDGPGAAGALVSTVDDLHLWLRALGQGRAIGADAWRQMTAPASPADPGGDAYGLGVYLWRVRGTTMIGHTGQIPGFASIAAYIPASDVTIVALGNDDTFDAREVGRRLAAIAIGQPYTAVVAVSPSPDEARALAGTYRFDDAILQTISVEDGTLYAQRGTRNRMRLQMTGEGRLHYVPDFLSFFVPIRDAAGRVVALDYFRDGEGPPRRMPRVEAEAPGPPTRRY